MKTNRGDARDREMWRVMWLIAAIVAVMIGTMTLASRWVLNTRAGVLAKAFVLVLLVGLASGCHTLSSEALAELETLAATSQANVNDPTVATNDNARRALWSDGRGFADILHDAKGTPIPDFYLVNPWAPVAPVPSAGK